MGRYVYSGVTCVNTGSKRVFFKAPAGTAACCYATTWTVPSGVTCATFELWGGGGAGAPNCCCNCHMGHPGSGGGYTMKTIAVTPGDVYTVVVGLGGCGSEQWYQSNACGCGGGTTYVTGTNLNNLCATGGAGGYWCNGASTSAVPGVGFGGDFNLRGKFGVSGTCCNYSGCYSSAFSGSAPFGGGMNIGPRGVGSCAVSLACAGSGNFPGGGGLPRPSLSSWCDCFAGCSGGGGDGLVIITI